MVAPLRGRIDSARLAGNLILAALVALAACGLYVGSYGTLALVPVALAIIGAGMALQLVPRVVVLAIAACISLVKACASMPGADGRLRSRIVSA